MKRRGLNCVFALLVAFAAATPRADDNPNDILIIANNKVAVNSVSIDELRDIFLKKKANWSDGAKVVPINAPKGSEIRAEFQKKILEITNDKEEKYWQERMIVSGVQPPPSLQSMQKAVFKINGAIGYIYRKDYRKGVVKILLVLP